MTITMDGVNYNLGVVFPSLERSFTFVEGLNGGLTLSGKTILDTIGTKYPYTMEVEPINGYQSDYDSFFFAISNPSRLHTVTLPFGQSTLTFDCYVLGGGDKLEGRRNSDWQWGGMTVNFVPFAPQR